MWPLQGVLATCGSKGKKTPRESLGRTHPNIRREGALPQGWTFRAVWDFYSPGGERLIPLTFPIMWVTLLALRNIYITYWLHRYLTCVFVCVCGCDGLTWAHVGPGSCVVLFVPGKLGHGESDLRNKSVLGAENQICEWTMLRAIFCSIWNLFREM